MTIHFLKAAGQPENVQNRYAGFRGIVPAGTELKIYADQFYELRADGELLGYGPVKSGEPLLYFDTWRFDRETFVAIQIHGRKNPPQIYLDSNRPIAWKAAVLSARAADTPCNVGEVGYSEYYDFNNNEINWAAKNYDDSTWLPPVPGRTVEKSHLIPRSIPMFHPVVKKPLSLTRKDSGWLADFGGMVYGRVFLSRKDGSGKEITLNYIEDFDRGWAHGEGRTVMYSDRLRNAPETFDWSTFNKRGFRYLFIQGVDAEPVALHVEEYPYPVREIGSFHCSDESLNRLWTISKRTLEICMDEIYNDCPHRDQAQWMDAFVSSRNAFYLFGDTKLARKSLLQHGICSFVDGRLLSPSIVGGGFLPDYALVQILYLLWYCRASGDCGILDELYENCVVGMDYFQRYRDSDYLLKDVSAQEFAYIDNAFELCRLGKSAAMNALYYGALNAMASLAELHHADSERWRKDAEKVRNSFMKVFAHESVANCFRDSDSRPEGPLKNINFSCEFGELWGCSDYSAKAVFLVSSAVETVKNVSAGAYGPFRLLLNGKTVLNDARGESWQRPAPCYDRKTVSIPLQKGENRFEFIVDGNGLNWDLFYSGIDADTCEIQLLDRKTGAPVRAVQKTSPRFWTPPVLSQTTHGYAAFCGLPCDLSKTVSEHYYRNYVSIRVPLFSEETADPEKLRNWIMPANTPWTGFFYLNGLFSQGLVTQGVEWLKKAWDVMLSRNAVNTWEEWSMNASLCHAWGSTPSYFMLREILGIHLDDLGAKKILIRPALLNLEYASGRAALSETEFVEVSLRRNGDFTEVRISVPSGYRVEKDLSRLKNPQEKK